MLTIFVSLIVMLTGSPMPADDAPALRGVATWYDDGPGLYGAAGPVLRDALGGDPAFRGRTVTVVGPDGSVTVTLSDWCGCDPRPGGPTLIDLSPTAFDAIGNLGAGVIPVTITVGGAAPGPGVTPPPTDTGPVP